MQWNNLINSNDVTVLFNDKSLFQIFPFFYFYQIFVFLCFFFLLTSLNVFVYRSSSVKLYLWTDISMFDFFDLHKRCAGKLSYVKAFDNLTSATCDRFCTSNSVLVIQKNLPNNYNKRWVNINLLDQTDS